MKKKSLLFLLLMALFAPWAANAQETLTVCDGTDGNSNVPIYGLYCDEGVKCEYIIPAALLADMENGTISAMKFYIKSISGVLSANFTVFMKEVNFTTMTAFTGTTGATTVYNGSISLTGTSTEMDIDFSENYTYTGGNLLVGFYQNGTSGYKSVTWTGENQTYASAWAGYGTSSNANGSSKNFLPKTTFTYTPGEAPACAKPTNLTVSNITSSTADITWVSPAPYFNFDFKKSADEQWTPIQTPYLYYNAAELEPNTTYDVRVKALCSVDPWEESPYATTQFTTDCGVITSFPWTEDFESYASGNFTDPCWVNEHISGSGTSIFKVYTSTNGGNSTHQLQLPDQSDGTLTKLVLPEMTLPSDNYEFVIDVYRNSSYSSKTGEGIRVFASTNGEIEGATELAFIPRVNTIESGIIPAEDAAGWYTYELPIGISGTCYIILRGENQYGTSTYMDNFKVKRIPTCLPPTGLHVAEVTAHSVRIEWDAEEGAMFQEDFNTMSFDPNEPPTNWNTQADYDNFATYSGLEPEHSYGIWVRKYCSADDQSEPIYITFTTTEACPAPTGLHVVEGSITSTGASFSWDAETGASFQYYTISDPWEGFEPTEETSWTDTPNNTVSWTNAFPANSVTRFYLRKNCGDEGYSDYTYVEFRTLCGPTSLINGYAEDFNDDTYTPVSTSTGAPSGYPNVALPYCWQFLNLSESTSTYPQAFLTSSSTYAVSGNCLFFKSSNATPLYAILPEFVQDISEYQLTFTYRNEGTGNSNGKLYVGYMTDPSDASTFVQTFACEQTTTLTPKTAYFANAPQGSFMAFKYEGGTYNNYYLSIDDVVVSNGPACFPTGTLDCVDLSSTTATLSWALIDFQQNAWVVEYSTTPQFFEPVVSVDATQNWNFVIEGLEPETQYYARVRGNCGDGSLSDVSNTITFTTLDACPLPTNLAASNLTQNTADLSWTGSVDVQQYQVWFRRAEQVVGIDEQFNTSTLDLEGWEVKTGLLSDIIAGGELSVWASPYWDCGTNNGVFDSHARLNIWGQGCKSWLITPRHTVKSGDTFTFDLALTAWSGDNVPAPATNGTDDRFVVLIGYNNGQNWEILREWNNSGSEYVYNNIANSATGEQVSIDLTEYVGCDVRIAFYGESTVSNADNNLHIDNVKIGTEYAAGGGNVVESQTTSVQLVGLEANTIYDVQVRSKCSDTWTDIFNFKTLDQYTKVFIGGQPLDGYNLEEVSDKWWNPNNWVPYGMPGAVNDSPNEDVILRHDAVISINLITDRNIIADANSITFEGDPKPTLTLEDGNQLRLNTEIDQPDVITVKKNIIGYAGTKDQYYLISSPVQWAGQYNPANGIVTTESDYDLYAFDPAASDGLEWRNYKAQAFSMEWGSGYLYANDADVMISVTGPVMDNKQPDEIFNYNYFENEDYQFNGWKLCGNTFTCNAYLSSDSQTMAFYRMNAEGTGFEAVTSVIKPMEGFFLQNTVRGERVVLSRTAPSKGVRCLNLVLSQVAARRDGVSTGSTTLDNAIVRFDEGNTLEKLSFREGSSKIYMPVEGKDYAVVNAGQMGELPVSFKAESNGSYTLSFTNEDVEFSYLHLIDNLTGNDVDLLANPSYSFDARTTDYASRFRLVFATGTSVEGDNFSFVNASGNLCIFGIEGEATVQVIDILGHVISSETFSGSYERKINGAPGVYMVRLINGNDVKVQKVVVR